MTKLELLMKNIWSILILLFGIILFFIGYTYLGLVIVFIGIFGILLRIYVSRKKIKFFSNEWNIMTLIVFAISFMIIHYLKPNAKWTIVEVFAYIIFLFILYLIGRIIPKKPKKELFH